MSKTKSKYIDVRNFQQDEYPWTFVVGARSVGKACTNDTKVVTPRGYVEIGSLKIGDKIVGFDGKFHDLIGIYPQGKKRVYKVYTRKNEYFKCCEEHLHGVWSRKDTYYTLTTKELKEKIENGSTIGIYKNGADFSEKQLPLDPYVIGAFLGDGCCKERQLVLSSEDYWIPAKISRLLKTNGFYSSRYNYNWFFISKNFPYRKRNKHNLLQSSILPIELRCGANEKRIPKDYLFASRSQRLKLLQGLLDTDGSVSKDNRVSFSSNSLKLVKDTQFLVESLGGTTSLFSNDRNDEIHHNTEYSLSIMFPRGLHEQLFTLPRKKSRLTQKQRKRNWYRILKIEETDEFEEMTCLEVDTQDHLFLIDHFIPTHNTISSFVSLIEEFKETGKMGIYMRRYDTEIENTAVDLGLLERLTGTKLQRDRVKINGVFTDCITVDEQPAIYMIALSVAGKYKSNAFPNISELVMDEFIDPAGRELKDETNKFLQFAMTVFRDMKSFKALFVANATNLFNNYFLDLEILPTGTVTRNKELGVKLVMYKTSEELDLERRQTTLAKLVERMEGQGNSSFDNKFSGNYDTFIRKIEGSAKYMGTYKLNNQEYGVYKNKECFVISHKFDPNHKNKRALTFEDVDEMYSLIDYEKYSILRGNFFNHRVFFSDVKTRTAFLKKFKKMSLYE